MYWDFKKSKYCKKFDKSFYQRDIFARVELVAPDSVGEGVVAGAEPVRRGRLHNAVVSSEMKYIVFLTQ
jgi:hypothetical protein